MLRALLVGGLALAGCEANPDFDPPDTQGGEGGGSTGEPDPDRPLGELCPPLPPADGEIVVVTPADAAGLGGIIDSAAPGATIEFEPGTYAMADGVYIDNPGVTLRSSTGNAQDVILDGQRTAGSLFLIVSSNVTVAEMTLQHAAEHLIHTSGSSEGEALGVRGYRLRLRDAGAIMFKMNPSTSGMPGDDGELACSSLEITDDYRAERGDLCSNSTGVAGFAVSGWTIRNNTFDGFWCPTGFTGAIHFSETSSDNIVERNTLRDCAVGIQFGIYEENEPARVIEDSPCTDGYYDHYRGRISNNMIVASGTGIASSEVGVDFGIGLWQVCEATVVHNTVVSAFPPSSAGIEYRFSRTKAKVLNNLVSHAIRDRDEAGVPIVGNLTDAPLNNFLDPLGGDVHILGGSEAIDAGVMLGEDAIPHDIDGDPRTGAPDVGADEF